MEIVLKMVCCLKTSLFKQFVAERSLTVCNQRYMNDLIRFD